MYLSKEVKADIFAKHGGKAENTGSAEGQIALFSFRINHLTEHLKRNRHDYNTERSLVKLVGKRRALLDYLKKTDINRYREIIKVLGIRK
ncbi:SSU ribosomal protein S15P [Flavobacterium glycines]|jgi:small subunit ribosomal protein S15|uniref:Small ribosomal subunit protein uS15 n=2 Tax=Flavobacterium TaxID=237 RepID=A0A1B9DRG6_9FLAO|nr:MULTISPECIES: 30S ribosomal protein S15 [Flavobacterium]OCB72280.1 30S ribosomal protein S15 [Flavobacterium glycines]GEL09744.1 30S ribosomal protein S15 [Flavobacterium glycines]GGA83715.1 30S ribosomal protein S15 [Flavobacterium palustre]SDI95372.1 SSU ribosomal protein S15P [Flavobacterium glycines]